MFNRKEAKPKVKVYVVESDPLQLANLRMNLVRTNYGENYTDITNPQTTSITVNNDPVDGPIYGNPVNMEILPPQPANLLPPKEVVTLNPEQIDSLAGQQEPFLLILGPSCLHLLQQAATHCSFEKPGTLGYIHKDIPEGSETEKFLKTGDIEAVAITPETKWETVLGTLFSFLAMKNSQ
jgi:hypothetical protein